MAVAANRVAAAGRAKKCKRSWKQSAKQVNVFCWDKRKWPFAALLSAVRCTIGRIIESNQRYGIIPRRPYVEFASVVLDLRNAPNLKKVIAIVKSMDDYYSIALGVSYFYCHD